MNGIRYTGVGIDIRMTFYLVLFPEYVLNQSKSTTLYDTYAKKETF